MERKEEASLVIVMHITKQLKIHFMPGDIFFILLVTNASGHVGDPC